MNISKWPGYLWLVAMGLSHQNTHTRQHGHRSHSDTVISKSQGSSRELIL